MQKELEVTRGLEPEDLKILAGTDGPCVTVYLPMEKSPNTAWIEDKRLKSVVRSAEQVLRERQFTPATIKELLDPLAAIADMRGHGGATTGGTLVVLRAKDILRAFEIPQQLN